MNENERRELVKEIDTILNKGDTYGLISDDRVDNTSYPVLHRKTVVKENQLPQMNTKEINNIISKLAEQITKQREIEFIEMNGNMLQDMLVNHNYGQFFDTSKSLEIRLDNTLEDKVVKIRYRR